MKKLATVLTVVTLLAVSQQARAKDVSGRIGIGGKAGLSSDAVAGLNAIYWLGDLGLEGIFGLTYQKPDGGDGAALLRMAFAAIFNLLKAERTNLGIGGRFSLSVGKFDGGETRSVSPGIEGGGSDGAGTGAQIDIEAPLRVEHFFTNNFAVNMETGFIITVRTEEPGKGFALGTTTGLFGTAGFLFYM